MGAPFQRLIQGCGIAWPILICSMAIICAAMPQGAAATAELPATLPAQTSPKRLPLYTLLGGALLGGILGAAWERARRGGKAPRLPPVEESSGVSEQEKVNAGKLQKIRSIAHDFNNLLTGVVGHLTLIREDPALPPPFARKLEAVESSAFKARDLTRELLRLAREGAPLNLPPSPAELPSPARKEPTPVKPPPPAAAHRRILAMDDEPAICALLCALLEHYGYEVTTVADGAAAVAQYRLAMDENRPFAAVIMDMNIPGKMGGVEAVQHLRKFDPNVKAIVSSGSSGDPAMIDYAAHGFAARVEKPYRLQELAQVLQSLVESGHRSQI